MIFYGSCQARAIAKLIEHVLPGEVVLNYTHILNKTPLPDHFYSTDILIYQMYHPVNEDHAEYHTDMIVKKIKSLNPHVKLVAVPFICFYGYWPDYTIDQRNAKTVSPTFPYGVFPQQSKILSQCSISQDALNVVNKVHYDAQEVFERIETLLEKTRHNDSMCDVVITDFIAANYRTSPPIFYSVQHPRNCVLLHVASQILKLLGIQGEPKFDTDELLDDHHALILPCVQTTLGISQTKMKLYDKRIVDAEQYAELYIKTMESVDV